MDFRTFVNKENFKAILLQHLKDQVKSSFNSAILKKLNENFEKEETTSTDALVSTISTDIFDSEEYPEFLNSFLGNVNTLLEDEDKYIPKNHKPACSSQCSSASSVNASSIDFLRPDQFQNIVQTLNNGTNAEKLEALATLHHLPTMEHVIHHFSWSDVEKGLHDSLSSKIVFLKAESLKFYVKMLSCPESKVVQESYLSLIKYFLQILLPSLSQISEECDFVSQCKSAVEILSILNKFLQNISTHWLRYPQSVIESITIQSLSILSTICNESSTFPIWMCFALCDPEAKWLKSLLHGHVSRACLLEALRKNKEILQQAVELCDKFCDEENTSLVKDECCQKSHLVANLSHVICFLSHLLQYSEGRKILSSEQEDKFLSNWISVLKIVMNSVYKLCDNSCFNCCLIVCGTVSKKWHYLLCYDKSSIPLDDLIQILATPFSTEDNVSLNTFYFAMQCFSETYQNFYVSHSIEPVKNIQDFVFQLFSQFTNHFSDCDWNDEPSVLYLFNASLILIKRIFLIPSSLFFNIDFIDILSKWWLKIKTLTGIKASVSNCQTVKYDKDIFSEIHKNMLDVSLCFLRKPVGINLCSDLSVFELGLNILLEKILEDLKSRHCVCSCDISILSTALNSSISVKTLLNKTIVFRLSSIIWQFIESGNDALENLPSLKCILENVLPSIFWDLTSTEIIKSSDLASENNLLENVLLFPNLSNEFIISEDYNILGLQIISLLSSSIHSVCLLQVKYNTTDLLLDLLSQHMSIDDEIVIDPISVLQNHILAKLFVVGGPSEKNLPDETFQNDSNSYNWPFITELPIPEVFYGSQNDSSDDDCQMEFNDDNLDVDLKEKILDLIQQKENHSPKFIFQLLKKSIDVLQCDLTFPLNVTTLDDSNSKLCEEEFAGIALVERYGKHLNLITDDDEGRLEQLLKASKTLIGSDESKKLDIFVCTVYLIFKSDIEIAWLFLQNFAKSFNSIFIWRELMVQISENTSQKYVKLSTIMLEWCDIVIKKTFPLLFSAFEFRGILPSVIYNYWTLQSYWNYLDFMEISHFVLLNVLYSFEYSLYFFASILKHLYNFILQNAHSNDLYSLLLKNSIQGFKACDYIDFMNNLSTTFHESISQSIVAVL
ncbi:Protein broad-minded [Araneus ventricosus]|uniref:Protein broad-minded n=1 Tax=Araneus ventricosus TaxID=182803 RepID=A0A4Y2GSU7_ARAVE|nr:Protein broad-minded [Araneus ventricosus]